MACSKESLVMSDLFTGTIPMPDKKGFIYHAKAMPDEALQYDAYYGY